MDIGAFLSTTFGQILATLSAGAIALAFAKFKDMVFFKLLTMFGDKYKEQIGGIITKKINKLLSVVRELDDKYLDPFKKQYPKTGTAIENEIADALEEGAKVLTKAAKIVKDEI